MVFSLCSAADTQDKSPELEAVALVVASELACS